MIYIQFPIGDAPLISMGTKIFIREYLLGRAKPGRVLAGRKRTNDPWVRDSGSEGENFGRRWWEAGPETF